MALPELTKTRMTVEAFERYAELPENRDKKLEYHAGEIIEVVSNDRSSQVAANIIILLGGYIKQQKLGRLTGADGGYMINGERYIPDVAFISASRQPKAIGQSWNHLAPDLAIEVLSPTDQATDVLDKVSNYLVAGVTIWVVDPIKQTVQVFAPNAAPRLLTSEETLEGGALLPGFSLSIASLFEDM